MEKYVFIIGATSDIGMAIAEKYAGEGYDLLLGARNTGRLVPLQSDLQIRFGIRCNLLELDLQQTTKLAGQWEALKRKPGISICVAGFMQDNDEVLRDTAASLQTIESNFTGPVLLLNRIALDYMEKRSGVIVGFSSVAGLRGRQSNFMYGSAKAGFIAYLSGLRNKLYHHQVHVLTVLPGFVYTKMTAHLKLPGLLTATPAQVASAVYKGITKKKNVVYVKWFWKWIMYIIRLIPEFLFKTKNL